MYKHASYIIVALEKLMGRDSGNWVIWRRIIWTSVRIWARSMKLLGIKPFDAFIASEFHGNASGLRHRSVYVDVDVAVDSFSCKVELFIGLDEEVSHKLQLDLDLIACHSGKYNISHIQQITKFIRTPTNEMHQQPPVS